DRGSMVDLGCGSGFCMQSKTPAWRVRVSGERWHGSQPGQPHQVVCGGHQIARELHTLEPAVARLSKATDRFHPTEDFFNGLFTNDKFCETAELAARILGRCSAAPV